MSYKVDYYTLARMDDGRIGNMRQSVGHFFTDLNIEEIPTAINRHLEMKKQVAVIVKIEDVKGICINS